MFKWRLLISTFVLFFVFSEAKAGDKEDVLAEMKNRYSALISGDVDAMRFNPAAPPRVVLPPTQPLARAALAQRCPTR